MRLLKSFLFLLIAATVFVAISFGVDKIYETVQKPKFDGASVVTDNPNSQKNITGIAKPYLVDGFDWSLPPNTVVEPYSGLIEENQSNFKYINNRFKILRWDEINPKNGVYRFSKLDQWLASIKPHKALIRLDVNSSCETPQWALEQLRFSKNKSLIFWDKAYLSTLKPLITAFGKRYASHPQIVGVQLGIGDGEYRGSCDDFDNKDGWGEFWMSPNELSEAQIDFGLTPNLFEQRSKEIIDIYQSAFRQHTGKLAFTNIGSLFSYGIEDANAYNKRLLKISKYALEKGIGNRDGEVEIWLRYLDKIYGNRFVSAGDGTCKLEFDEPFADRIAGRYWGSENEFYGKSSYITDLYGPDSNQPYRFLISSLRILQMRRNFFSLSGADFISMDDPIYKTQNFFRYLTQVMGKQKHNTPDAFVLLGERYITADRANDYAEEACVKNKNKVAIRSFGRWLTESSQSILSMKIKMPKEENYWAQDFYLPDGIDYEYAARSSNKFEFNLNNELSQKRCEFGCDVEIKVVFKDINKTMMFVRIAEGITTRVQTLGDNKIKTVTFNVKSEFIDGLNNNLSKGYDFSVETSGVNLAVILVRVNFH